MNRSAPSPEPLVDRAPGVLPATAEHWRVPLSSGPTIAVTRLPGEGEPVVWLHPSRTGRRVFDHAVAASGLGRPILIPELCGHGDSDRPAVARDLDGHVADLIRFADIAELDRFAIVGQATGATLGLLLASHLPGRVSALAVGDVALGLRRSVFEMVAAQEKAFTARGFATPEEAMAATPFSERWSPSVRGHWLKTMLETDVDGALRWRYDAATVLATMEDMVTDRWEEVNVAAPVLLFRGAENTAIERAEIERGLRRLPQARAAELPLADHRLCQDDPEGFARLVDDFLADAARCDGRDA